MQTLELKDAFLRESTTQFDITGLDKAPHLIVCKPTALALKRSYKRVFAAKLLTHRPFCVVIQVTLIHILVFVIFRIPMVGGFAEQRRKSVQLRHHRYKFHNLGDRIFDDQRAVPFLVGRLDDQKRVRELDRPNCVCCISSTKDGIILASSTDTDSSSWNELYQVRHRRVAARGAYSEALVPLASNSLTRSGVSSSSRYEPPVTESSRPSSKLIWNLDAILGGGSVTTRDRHDDRGTFSSSLTSV